MSKIKSKILISFGNNSKYYEEVEDDIRSGVVKTPEYAITTIDYGDNGITPPIMEFRDPCFVDFFKALTYAMQQIDCGGEALDFEKKFHGDKELKYQSLKKFMNMLCLTQRDLSRTMRFFIEIADDKFYFGLEFPYASKSYKNSTLFGVTDHKGTFLSGDKIFRIESDSLPLESQILDAIISKLKSCYSLSSNNENGFLARNIGKTQISQVFEYMRDINYYNELSEDIIEDKKRKLMTEYNLTKCVATIEPTLQNTQFKASRYDYISKDFDKAYEINPKIAGIQHLFREPGFYYRTTPAIIF